MPAGNVTNPATLTEGLHIYSSHIIEALQDALKPIEIFAHDYSDEFKDTGDTVNVPYVYPGTVKPYNDVSYNYETMPDVKQMKGCQIKLTEHPLAKFAVTPNMVQNFRPEQYIKQAEIDLPELIGQMYSTILGVATGSKATAKNLLPSGSSVTIESVNNIAKEAYKLKIQPERAGLFLTPDDFTSLKNDLRYDATGKTSITQADIGVNFGFKRIQCLPPTATKSFVGTDDYVMTASRPYLGAILGSGGSILEEKLFTDPITRFTLVTTLVRIGATKVIIGNTDCLFGAEMGNKEAGFVVTHTA